VATKSAQGKSLGKKYTFVLIASTITFFLLSELIYQINNRSQLGVYDYLNMASTSADKSDIEETIKLLGKASELRLKGEVIKEHPDIEMQSTISTPPLPKDKAVQEEYSNYLKSIDYEELKREDASRWAKIYYSLGLLAYEQNEPGLVAPFWKIAANLGPEWSYFHIELANFYLSRGEPDKAKEQIEFCLQFQNPKTHCSEFMQEHIQTNNAQPVGTWQDKINDI